MVLSIACYEMLSKEGVSEMIAIVGDKSVKHRMENLKRISSQPQFS